jgi:hypothetical protein
MEKNRPWFRGSAPGRVVPIPQSAAKSFAPTPTCIVLQMAFEVSTALSLRLSKIPELNSWLFMVAPLDDYSVEE